jgi:hypothetical protein
MNKIWELSMAGRFFIVEYFPSNQVPEAKFCNKKWLIS